jgi:hypothetical protein
MRWQRWSSLQRTDDAGWNLFQVCLHVARWTTKLGGSGFALPVVGEVLSSTNVVLAG